MPGRLKSEMKEESNECRDRLLEWLTSKDETDCEDCWTQFKQNKPANKAVVSALVAVGICVKIV